MTLFTPLQDLLGKDVFQIPGEFDPARHVHEFLYHIQAIIEVELV